MSAEEQVRRFAGWEIRPDERTLLVRGEPVKIGSRAFDVLLALVRRRGHVVSKADLLDAAWPGLVVEENNLSVQIATLRKLLGPPAIATVAGLGYRLAAANDGGMIEAPARTVPLRPAAIPMPHLLGREVELKSLLDQVGAVPLVSVVGPGGVGKTTLARAVLAQSAQTWRDGIHWIDLTPLTDGSRLLRLVAQSLGVIHKDSPQAADELCDALAPLQALIAVDNCEHLLGDVGQIVGKAIARVPGVRWLATSREPLHVQGETVYRLEPLQVPDESVEFQEAVAYGAMALLSGRVLAVDHRFELNADNLQVAAALCRRLDGLPLAIEMAAARVATVGLRGVYEQLGQRLRLKAGPSATRPGHQTLEQTFDWSYGLLAPVEQRVFRSLEPFVGGFTASMAQRSCSRVRRGAEPLDDWQVLEALGALVHKSLVQRGRGPGPDDRFHLFESARDYARLCLAESGEFEDIRRAHAHAVTDWFDTNHADFEQIRDQDWRARCMPERHNVRAALDWACQASEFDLVARLVVAQGAYDHVAHDQPELVDAKVSFEMLANASMPARARACLECGWSHYLRGNRETGAELVSHALADFEQAGDTVGIYRALARLIRLCEARPGMLDKARELWARLRSIDEKQLPLRTRLHCTISAGLLYGGRNIARLQELHEIAQRSGFDALAAVCRTHITDELIVQRRFEEAVETAQTMLANPQVLPRERALVCHNQALALIQLGGVDEAIAPARMVLRTMPHMTHMIIDLFALAAARCGRFVDAALMAGYSTEHKRSRDWRSDPAEAAVVVETRRLINEGLGADRYAELTSVGAAMPGAHVLALALPTQGSARPPTAEPTATAPDRST